MPPKIRNLRKTKMRAKQLHLNNIVQTAFSFVKTNNLRICKNNFPTFISITQQS